MADNPPDGDDDLLWNDDAALAIGGKVLEMVERLVPMHRITPGVKASWRVEIDGQCFTLTLAYSDGT